MECASTTAEVSNTTVGASLLSVEDLHVHFVTSRGVVRAVEGVNWRVYPGEMVALVGESGCGKSVSALAVMRLLAKPAGRIVARPHPVRGPQPARAVRRRVMREVRGRDISMIFQEPMTSLNPVLTIGLQIMEPLLIHKGMNEAQATSRAARAAADGRHLRCRAPARPVSAPVLRRHAPAGDDRDRARVQSEADHRRRADHRARRHDPGADPAADEGPVARARHRDGGDHAQPRHRRALRRPRERDVRGAHGRAGHGGRACSRSRCIPTPSACCARCRGSTGRAARKLETIEGLPPSLLDAAARLPLRAALPGAAGRLRS